MITCHNPECKQEQFMTFPENVNIEKREFQCKECKTKLYKSDRRMGRWVAQNPKAKVSGYTFRY